MGCAEKFQNQASGGWTSRQRSVLIILQPNSQLMSPLTIDPALLDPAAIPAETKTLNDGIVARLNAEPARLTIPEIRARRLQGLGAFPLVPKSPRAETIGTAGSARKPELPVIAPQSP